MQGVMLLLEIVVVLLLLVEVSIRLRARRRRLQNKSSAPVFVSARSVRTTDVPKTRSEAPAERPLPPP